jgi:hypothetical protein
VKEKLFDLIDDIIASVINARREIQLAAGTTNLLATMEKKDDLARLANSFAQSKPQEGVVGEGEKVEATTDDVVPLRTMGGDINKIHGYGAFNAAQEEQTPNTSKL